MFHKNQMGFTLIELMLAIAISGVITGGITMTIFQVVDGSARTNNHMTAVRQVQNAGYWVSHDGQMAQSMVIAGVSGFPLTLTWTDWDGTVNEVIYTLEGTELWRDYNGQRSPVAQFIDPNVTKTKCEFTGGGAGAFNLPDAHGGAEDALTITDAVGGDSGTITVAGPGDVVKVRPVGGGATVNGGTAEVTLGPGGDTVSWATPNPGNQIIVTATAMNTTGSWTATTGTATATITVDSDNNATLAADGALVFRVTATVGTGSQEASETRTYEIVPRPSI